MKRLAPYKKSLPGNTTLIKGGILEGPAKAVMLIVFMALIILPLYKDLDVTQGFLSLAIGIAWLWIFPFFGRFSFKLSPSFVTIRIRQFGFTTNYMHVPFSKVIITESGLPCVNKDAFKDYPANKDSYLKLEYNIYDNVTLAHVSCKYGGKELLFFGRGYPFETEFWDMLTAAIKETDELKQSRPTSE